jgi:hypothetical protein
MREPNYPTLPGELLETLLKPIQELLNLIILKKGIFNQEYPELFARSADYQGEFLHVAATLGSLIPSEH